jgi:hypothetical protein
MMSRAEQDIDSEFVTKFEAVVKDRDDHRPIFLKQAHILGLAQDTLSICKGEYDDIYNALVEDGVNAELREKSATVVDEVKPKTMIKITGAGLRAK